ncbi:hypothetical protein Tco_1091850 [Tanacetum coccineum]|uniref:Uncharacterized protein n=1 Tax=Tanacetum coccineum TaxID=301880 RepID=A0ABQ5I871_9ASTR
MRKIVDGIEGRHECVLLTQEYVRKIIKNASDDDDFTHGLWFSAIHYINDEWAILIGCFGDIKSFIKHRKLKKVVIVIKSCKPNALGDLTVILKDPSGDGTDVGGSRMLGEEELMKLLEEEERVEQEFQLDGILRIAYKLNLFMLEDPTFRASGDVTPSPTSGALGALTPKMQLFNLTFLLICFLTTCLTRASRALRKSTHPVMAINLYLLVVEGFEVEGFAIGGFKVEGLKVEGFEVVGFDVKAFEVEAAFEVE